MLFYLLFGIFFVNKEAYMQKILSLMRKACNDYNLIEDGDKIAVGVSGGKDSLLLLAALAAYRRFCPQKYTLVAISVDLSNGKMDYSEIEKYCEKLNVPFKLVPSNVFEVVFDTRKEQNPCSLCANMRRGLLNTAAKELGCNKVALGHHKDDLVETFIMSLFFEGRLSTFKPKTYLSKTDLNVIRPLIYCEEKDIVSFSEKLPVLHNICPVDHKSQRENAKIFLKEIDKKYNDAKNKIFNAIIHTERYNLFDK